MNTLKDLFEDLLVMFGIVLIASGAVLFVSSFFDVRQSQSETRADQFRRVCASLNGTVVWNGRNWECLK